MCDQRERLMDYLYDEVAPADRRTVEAHLESCDTCRQDVRAFRRVREDLLAWEVPEFQSVWTPFAPTPVVPWYSQVPAWAMTAAAGVMLLLGTAGGFAAQALLATTPEQTTVAAPTLTPAPTLMPVQTSFDESAVRSLIKREMAGSGLVRVANTVPGLHPSVRQDLLREAEVMIFERHKQQWELMGQFVSKVQSERATERKEFQITLGNLRDQVAGLQQTVNFLVTQQNAKGQQQ